MTALRTTICRRGCAAALGAILLFGGHRAAASTVADMTAAEIADHAGQVIEGVVTSTRSYWTASPTGGPDRRRIETEIVLSDVTYWKGRHRGAGDSFTLILPGGTVGQTQMRLCCTPQLEVGQRWILCLLPEYKTYPVVGLWQGAFEVREDLDGTQRVYQASAFPIAGLDDDGAFVAAQPVSADARGNLLHANNVRVMPARDNAPPAQAMTLNEFKATMQPILKASRDHRMKRPAGRRVPVNYTKTTLKPAPGAAQANPATAQNTAADEDCEDASGKRTDDSDAEGASS